MEQQKIISRIQKLLNLAKGNTNEHEAQVAMLKAQEYMAEYGITMSELDVEDKPKITKSDIGHETLSKDYGRAIWWHRDLAKIIAKNFKCSYYIDVLYKNGKPDKNKMKLKFMGLKDDVAIAKIVFEFAVKEIEMGADRCYAKYYNSGLATKGIKADYIEGFLKGLKDKFDEQVKNIEQKYLETKSTALVLLDLHPVVKQAVNDMQFASLHLNSSSGAQGNSGAKNMGYKDGKKFDGNPNKITN